MKRGTMRRMREIGVLVSMIKTFFNYSRVVYGG
jgi:hypothetical protein